MNQVYFVSINTKGQLTLPVNVRNLFNIKTNSKIQLLVNNDVIQIKKPDVKNLKDIRDRFLKEANTKKIYNSLGELYTDMDENVHNR